MTAEARNKTQTALFQPQISALHLGDHRRPRQIKAREKFTTEPPLAPDPGKACASCAHILLECVYLCACQRPGPVPHVHLCTRQVCACGSLIDITMGKSTKRKYQHGPPPTAVVPPKTNGLPTSQNESFPTIKIVRQKVVTFPTNTAAFQPNRAPNKRAVAHQDWLCKQKIWASI